MPSSKSLLAAGNISVVTAFQGWCQWSLAFWALGGPSWLADPSLVPRLPRALGSFWLLCWLFLPLPGTWISQQDCPIVHPYLWVVVSLFPLPSTRIKPYPKAKVICLGHHYPVCLLLFTILPQGWSLFLCSQMAGVFTNDRSSGNTFPNPQALTNFWSSCWDSSKKFWRRIRLHAVPMQCLGLWIAFLG